MFCLIATAWCDRLDTFRLMTWPGSVTFELLAVHPLRVRCIGSPLSDLNRALAFDARFLPNANRTDVVSCLVNDSSNCRGSLVMSGSAIHSSNGHSSANLMVSRPAIDSRSCCGFSAVRCSASDSWGCCGSSESMICLVVQRENNWFPRFDFVFQCRTHFDWLWFALSLVQ